MAEPRSVKRLALREWWLMSAILLALTATLIYWHRVDRINLGLYDRFMQVIPELVRDDIVIVAIDDYSLTELGKWPWSRDKHAQLIQQIAAAKPKAIGIDILFAEPDLQTNDDQPLAQALTASGNVVLPVVSLNAGQGLSAALPLPELTAASKQLGHIHLELDQDGIARSVFLKEGIDGQWWSHFSLALMEVGEKSAALRLPGTRAPTTANSTSTNAPKQRSVGTQASWLRDYHMHIRYYGNSGHFSSVPYVAALRGEVPADYFHNKYVLIGATALGMSDSFATPVSDSDGVLSGIEINANILANLLDHNSITLASQPAVLAYNLDAVLLALLVFLTFSPRIALLTTILLVGSLCLISELALRQGYWLPPAAGLIGLLLAYPLWSWRRLEAAIRYLGEEFILLDREPHVLPELVDEPATPARRLPWKPVQDKLEQRITAMQTAARRVRDLRRFVSDSIDSLPDPTIVTSTDGYVLLANPHAITYFSEIGAPKVREALAPYLFKKMKHAIGSHAEVTFSWWNLLDLEQTRLMAQGIEVRDLLGRDLIVKSAPCYASSGELSGWIISLHNISAIRMAERRRDETLNFISHDMRAPQASILALLELQRDASSALPQEEFLKRIESASRITLGLADNFVHLARAESQAYRLEPIDMQDVLLDATEEMWTMARSKHIRIVTNTPSPAYPVRVDRSLMTRALTNLLSNAIKYSPPNTTITCLLTISTELAGGFVTCSISDQGVGISHSDQHKMFQRFQRFQQNDKPKNEGVGLGMVFVKTVIDRHQGSIDFTSELNKGTTFHIRLPIHQDSN